MVKHIFGEGNNWVAVTEYSASATFSCKHKVTKRPICAIPCNGIKELCEDDADEMCQGTGLVIVLSTTFVLATLFTTAAFLMRRFINMKPTNPKQEVLEMDQLGQTNENDILIFKSRLSLYKCKLDFENSILLVETFYHQSSLGTDHVDKHLMYIMGTCELTAFFYDCIDISIMIKVGSFLQYYLPQLLQAWGKWKIQDIYEVIQCIISMSIRYTDLPKDILFLYLVWVQLGNYSTGSFPTVIFWTLFTSIVVAEVLHCISIMMFQPTFMGRNALALFLTPLMPAFYMYEKLHLKLRIGQIWRKSDKTHHMQYEKVQKYETKCCQLQLIAAKMQCTENVLENLTLFTILIMVTSLSYTRSRAVENIDNIFIEENEYLGYILATMSFFSMIRGQLTFLKANKNGCVGIKGTFLVAPYFVLGTCSRYKNILKYMYPRLLFNP